MTWSPDSRLRLGDTTPKLDGHQERGMWHKSELCWIFTLEMQLDGLLQVLDRFVECAALRHKAEF